MNTSMELVPPGRGPRLWLFGLTVLLPLGITAVAVASRLTGAGHLFAANTTWTSLTPPSLIALAVIALWWVLDRAMRRHHLDVGDGRIRVSTSFYSKTLTLAELQLDAARVVDLEERTEFKPRLKTNGYALPGFHSGHFRLRNGEAAFVAIAGGRRALWLPTHGKQALLLQPRQPDALLAHLRELAKATPRR